MKLKVPQTQNIKDKTYKVIYNNGSQIILKAKTKYEAINMAMDFVWKLGEPRIIKEL